MAWKALTMMAADARVFATSTFIVAGVNDKIFRVFAN